MHPKLKRLNKGDAVEVRFATHDGYLWHPATVVFANCDVIEVEYPAGHTKQLPRNGDDYRVPTGKIDA